MLTSFALFLAPFLLLLLLFTCQYLFIYFQLEHPDLNILQRDTFIWSLSNVHLVETYISVLDGDPQEVVKSVFHLYRTTVVPRRSEFRKCEFDIYLTVSSKLCF